MRRRASVMKKLTNRQIVERASEVLDLMARRLSFRKYRLDELENKLAQLAVQCALSSFRQADRSFNTFRPFIRKWAQPVLMDEIRTRIFPERVKAHARRKATIKIDGQGASLSDSLIDTALKNSGAGEPRDWVLTTSFEQSYLYRQNGGMVKYDVSGAGDWYDIPARGTRGVRWIEVKDYPVNLIRIDGPGRKSCLINNLGTESGLSERRK